MPLIQWIMQNLDQRGEGVLAAGNADIQALYYETATGQALLSGEAVEFVVSPGQLAGVKAGGSALYNKIINVFGTGGLKASGKANLKTFKRKKINYLPGQEVYKCKNKWIVVSFSYSSVNSEPKYQVKNGYTNSSFFESEITPEPVILYNEDCDFEEDYPVFAGEQLVGIPSEEIFGIDPALIARRIATLEKPPSNYPVYEGLKLIQINNYIISKCKSFTAVNSVSNNFPVYSGGKLIQKSQLNDERLEKLIDISDIPEYNFPVYSGRKKVQQN